MPSDNSNKRESPFLRSFATWAVVLVMTFASVTALGLVIRTLYRDDDLQKKLMADHVRAIVGVPIAAASAFCVLLVLEARGGAIEFEVPGIRFRGASGPAIIWVFAFLAFASVIRLLW